MKETTLQTKFESIYHECQWSLKSRVKPENLKTQRISHIFHSLNKEHLEQAKKYIKYTPEQETRSKLDIVRSIHLVDYQRFERLYVVEHYFTPVK